ncbi:putative ORFan [Tupanvirus deep ocean]|uniref:ORFan n=2 Tax=Tupanvirus TaxID=2094720 RepID=A0AC62A7Q2_9VIRU|nr:putative ORFan [Tupanvirus deep ocean]QKU33809.1 putative ORFan [Tupanvirus deep ocean]
MQSIELTEFMDWSITNSMDNLTRKNKSIEAYYLDKWYDQVKEITFRTYIYPIENNIEDACPDILPFEKCMVKYENKSPKDSEFWGPMKTKKDIVNVFKTSLRCQKYPGKYLCIREWNDCIVEEFRCFWNKGLVACGAQSYETIFDMKKCTEIKNYIDKIKKYIPYQRCVFDIARISGTYFESDKTDSEGSFPENFILIEFNSWETNCGAYPFDWVIDTEIMYPDTSKNNYTIIFRSLDNTEIKLVEPVLNLLKCVPFELGNIKILKPNRPSNWLVTDKYIYVSTDIWLGCFDLNLNNLCWKRGVYRFCNIIPCNDGTILVGDQRYHYDLSKTSSKSTPDTNYFQDSGMYKENDMYRYGFYCKQNDIIKFCRLHNNGNFELCVPLPLIYN